MADSTTCTESNVHLPGYCERHENGTLPPGMCFFEEFLIDAAGPAREVMLNRGAVLVSFLMILQFHVMPLLAYACEKYRLTIGKRAIRAAFGRSRKSMFARSLGRHIWILNIYFSTMYEDLENNWLHFHEAFLESIIFAFFESFVGVIFRWLQKKKGRDYDKHLGDDALGAQLVGTKFADFSVPWSFSTVIFAAQFALFLFFVLDMNNNDYKDCRCAMNPFHWFAAVLVTNVSGHGESGMMFQYSVWQELKKCQSNNKKYKVIDHPKMYYSRMAFDFIINGFSREVLLCLAPVALSVVDRDDLIKDSLAIFFISRMDDLTEDRTIDQAIKDWYRERRHHDNPNAGEAPDETDEINEGEPDPLLRETDF
jgi:hypothetical protein